MKILVIGGTRFFGRAFTELALSKGHEVTVFHRGQSNSEHFDGANRVIGDRHYDLEKLDDGPWDAVLDTCAYVPASVTQAAEYLKGKAGQYVLISTISVYTDTPEVNRNEDAALQVHPEDAPINEMKMEHYGSLKVLCEQAAYEVFGDHTTIIRPGLIVGPHDPTHRFTYWPVRIRKGGDVLVPGDGSTAVQIIDARDLAAFTLKTIEDRAYETFHVTGPQTPHTLKTVIETARTISGSDANFIYADADWLLENDVGPWMEMPLWLPTESGQALMNVDIQRALDAGLTLRSLEETIRDTLAWYDATNGDEDDWPAGIKPEREAELLKQWSAKP